MFAIELSMEKWIKKSLAAAFSVIPAINAFGFSTDPSLGFWIKVVNFRFL